MWCVYSKRELQELPAQGGMEVTYLRVLSDLMTLCEDAISFLP